MSDNREVLQEQDWRNWSDEKLARSLVELRLKEYDTKLAEVKADMAAGSYTPKFGGTTDAEQGSMDAYDNTVSDLEHGEDGEEHEPYDPNEAFNELSQERSSWEEDLKVLDDKTGNKEDRDRQVASLANMERERREKLEKASAKPQT